MWVRELLNVKERWERRGMIIRCKKDKGNEKRNDFPRHFDGSYIGSIT
jgi:hypothetical protein